GREADLGLLADLRRRRGRRVEGVERNGFLAEADAYADDRTQEAHLSDLAAQRRIATGLAAERYRLGAKRERQFLTGLRAVQPAFQGELARTDAHGTGGRVGYRPFDDIQRTD